MIINLYKNKKLTTEEFVRRAKLVHGDRYGYLNSNYVNSKTELLITCFEHGDFSQKATVHLQGKGCKKCARNQKHTIEDFIVKARLIHGDKYIYLKLICINGKTEVLGICPEHGEFRHLVYNHLNGSCCKRCASKKFAKSKILTTEEFIRRARIIHGDKYGYLNSNYINGKTEVLITCFEHGDFNQKATVHLQGKGCKYCRQSKGEKRIIQYLDKLQLYYKDQHIYNECKYKRTLPFDFIVKIKENLEFLIEYQGKQHYHPISFGSKNKNPHERLVENQKRDKIKQDFCEKNNIPLLIIPYWEFKKIEEKIDEFIENLLKTNLCHYLS